MTAFQWKSRMRIWRLWATLVLVALQPIGAMAAGDRLASIGASLLQIKEMIQRIYITELNRQPTDTIRGAPYACSQEDTFRALTEIKNDQIVINPRAYLAPNFHIAVTALGNSSVWPFVLCSPVEFPTLNENGMDKMMDELESGKMAIRFPNTGNNEQFLMALVEFIENPENALPKYKISKDRGQFIIDFWRSQTQSGVERQHRSISGWILFDESQQLSPALRAITKLFKSKIDRLQSLPGFTTVQFTVVPP